MKLKKKYTMPTASVSDTVLYNVLHSYSIFATMHNARCTWTVPQHLSARKAVPQHLPAV